MNNSLFLRERIKRIFPEMYKPNQVQRKTTFIPRKHCIKHVMNRSFLVRTSAIIKISQKVLKYVQISTRVQSSEMSPEKQFSYLGSSCHASLLKGKQPMSRTPKIHQPIDNSLFHNAKIL